MALKNASVIVLQKEVEIIAVFTSIEALLQSEVSPLCGKITRGGLQKIREKNGGYPFAYAGFIVNKFPLTNQKTKHFTDAVFDDTN